LPPRQQLVFLPTGAEVEGRVTAEAWINQYTFVFIPLSKFVTMLTLGFVAENKMKAKIALFIVVLLNILINPLNARGLGGS